MEKETSKINEESSRSIRLQRNRGLSYGSSHSGSRPPSSLTTTAGKGGRGSWQVMLVPFPLLPSSLFLHTSSFFSPCSLLSPALFCLILYFIFIYVRGISTSLFFLGYLRVSSGFLCHFIYKYQFYWSSSLVFLCCMQQLCM